MPENQKSTEQDLFNQIAKLRTDLRTILVFDNLDTGIAFNETMCIIENCFMILNAKLKEIDNKISPK